MQNHLTNRNAFRFFKKTLALGLILAAFGCITVNVNFPESAVQHAADDFVNDLYNDKSSTPTAQTADPTVTPKSKKSHHKKAVPSEPTGFQFDLFSSAMAAEIDPPSEPNFHTPGAEKIVEQIRPLIPEIKKYKQMGVFGETIDGDLVIKDQKKADARAKEVEKEERSLRKKLYETLADDNHTNVKIIRKTMSKSLREHSPPGTWIEDESGWHQKK